MLKITLIISIETYKEATQLVSTSDKRPSSGEMKIDLKRVDIDGEMDLTLVQICNEMLSHYTVMLPNSSSFILGNIESTHSILGCTFIVVLLVVHSSRAG